ncbi:MAG: PQQ-binding-like beta-propeller repeat protein [Opitutaceae bacterium]|nr:PQQ-binding-like beta-propeller repeat protein [Opitutaceae bacterium]
MTNSPARVTISFFLGCSAAFAAADNANWPQWRGPDNNGTTPISALPRKVDAANVLWKAPLPGKGCSTPIVWNQHVYLTAPVGGKDAVLAFDWSGKQVWQTTFGGEDKGKHRNGSGSNPSPATDGKGIFVTFKSGNVAALNLDGTIRWQVNLVEKFGPVSLFWDYGTSPALTEKNVIIARMHAGESWLAAFDKLTGQVRWKTARNYETPREVDQGYSTPLVIPYDGREALLTWGAEHLTVHDAADGKLLWSCGEFNPSATALWPAVASPLVADGVAVVCFGRADKGVPRLHGIKLAGKGDVTATNRLWQREDVGAFVPTPAEYKGRVYVLSDRGQLDCLDPRTGKTLWTQTLPRSSSNFYASPLVANGIMYAAREDGTVFVLQIDGGFKVLSETKFSDRVIASIVPATDRLFVRGEANLYCIAAQ